VKTANLTKVYGFQFDSDNYWIREARNMKFSMNTNYVRNAVCTSTITNTVTVRNVEVISVKIITGKIWTIGKAI
jgi:hypothetical protein